MNGGYIMIKASDADIYLEASRALNIGKPILFYENDTTCYYIDTITLDGTNVVLTKGGKTITIANDNTITSVGDIQLQLNHYYMEITGDDDQENSRSIIFDFYTFDKFENGEEIKDFTLINKYIKFYQLGFEDEADEIVTSKNYDATNERFNFSYTNGNGYYIPEVNIEVRVRY